MRFYLSRCARFERWPKVEHSIWRSGGVDRERETLIYWLGFMLYVCVPMQ